MNKIDSLRTALEAALPELRQDRDRLAVFVDKGRVVSRLKPGLGYEYRYEVTLWLEAFKRGADAIMVPLLLWLREHQPDLLLDFAREDSAITFQADIVDETSVDLLIRLPLTEAVTLVARGDGSGWDVTHLPEPSPFDPALGIDPPARLQQIWLDGELLVE